MGLVVVFLLAEHKVDIKFICYTNFGPKINYAAAKLRYIQKATKSFAYVEDTKLCKNRLDRHASSIADFYGEKQSSLLYTRNSNNCDVCGAAVGIL